MESSSDDKAVNHRFCAMSHRPQPPPASAGAKQRFGAVVIDETPPKRQDDRGWKAKTVES